MRLTPRKFHYGYSSVFGEVRSAVAIENQCHAPAVTTCVDNMRCLRRGGHGINQMFCKQHAKIYERECSISDSCDNESQGV